MKKKKPLKLKKNERTHYNTLIFVQNKTMKYIILLILLIPFISLAIPQVERSSTSTSVTTTFTVPGDASHYTDTTNKTMPPVSKDSTEHDNK